MEAPVAWVISRDPEMRRLILLNLNRRGLPSSGTSALGDPHPPLIQPQVVILDVDPFVERETAHTLRRTPWLRGVPFILIITAKPAASELAALEPVRCAHKPLDMAELLTLIRESLTGRGIGQESPLPLRNQSNSTGEQKSR
jgi:hypothetical protein